MSMSNEGKQAQQIRNDFYRAADAPVNTPVKTREGWTLQPSGSRERACALARQAHTLYLANAGDPWVCQAWAQVEAYAVSQMLRWQP